MFVVFIPITIGELKSGVCRWRNVWKTIFLVYSFCSSSIFLCIKTKWFIFQCIIFFGFSMLWYVTLVIVTLEKIKRKCTFNRLLSIYLFLLWFYELSFFYLQVYLTEVKTPISRWIWFQRLRILLYIKV